MKSLSLSLLATIAVGLLAPSALPAQERSTLTYIQVTTLVDEDDGTIDPSLGTGTSLREAITLGNFEFDPNLDLTSLSGTLSLNSSLPPITGSMQITGPGAGSLTINGNGNRIFFIDAPDVLISGVALKDGYAKGGDGGSGIIPQIGVGGGAGGGGAAGMGGAIFINSGNTFTTDVAFVDNTAQGGDGGPGYCYHQDSAGGGGIGGDGQDVYPSYSAGDGGGGGSLGGAGGTGGVGGPGGNGGPGAGGGGSPTRFTGTLDILDGYDGGAGGFGGGGGGGGGGNYLGDAGFGGTGGFGGGGGGAGELRALNQTRIDGIGGPFGGNSNNGCGGGGGAGLGGAIFARAGSSLTVTNCTFDRNNAIGGAGGHSSNGESGSPGEGKGGAIFIMEGATYSQTGIYYGGDNMASDDAQTIFDNDNFYGNVVQPIDPDVQSITRLDPQLSNLHSVSSRTDFSLAASGVDASDFQVNTLTGSFDSLSIGDVTNPFTGAMSFDSPTDRLIVPNIANFPTDAFTVEMWLRPNGSSFSNQYIFSYAVAGTDNEILLGDLGNLVIFINGSYFTTGIDINSGGGGDWTHLAVSWRSSDGAYTVYRNGVVAGSGTLSAGVPISSGGYLVLAEDQDSLGGGFSASQFYIGDMDEVRVWNDVRSEAEIQANMFKTLSGSDPSLAAYYKFTALEDLGVTVPSAGSLDVADASGNNNNGDTSAGTTISTTPAVPSPQWDTEIVVGNGEGSFDITLVDDDSIVTPYGGILGGSGAGNGNFTTDQPYEVDTLDPTPVSMTYSGANPTDSQELRVPVRFSEVVKGVDPTDFSLGLTGVVGAAITGFDSIFGDALSLTASGYIRTTDHSAINDLTNGFTIEFWIYPNSDGSSGHIFSATPDAANGFSVYFSQRRVIFIRYPDNVFHGNYNEVMPGQWSHVACVYDENNLNTVYVNGEIAHTRQGDAPAGTTSGGFTIGAWNIDPSLAQFDGKIDELHVWDRTLTRAEILDHMGRRMSPPETDLLLSMGFEGDLANDGPTTPVLTTTGTIGYAPNSNPIVGTEWVALVDTGTGEGILDLNLLNDGSITDVLGNPLSGSLSPVEVFIDRGDPGIPLVVDTLIDENDGYLVGDVSLRDAINFAQGNGIPANITFAGAASSGTLTLTNGMLPVIDGDITITGNTPPIVIDAGSASRHFLVRAGSLSLENLDLQNGQSAGYAGGQKSSFGGSGGGGAGMGGSIFVNTGATLTAHNVSFDANVAVGGGVNSGTANSGSGSGGGGFASNGQNATSFPGNGGSGGPLGTAAAGGKGGTYGYNVPGTVGGPGGFGAGGGGGGGTNNSTPGVGGDGGYGGGAAGAGRRWQVNAANGQPGSAGEFAGEGAGQIGGAGAGLGGAIFVRDGGTIAFTSVALTNNQANGGTGGANRGQGKGGAIFIMPGASFNGTDLTLEGNAAEDSSSFGFYPETFLDNNDIYGFASGTGQTEWMMLY
ncbi:hypothetical protein KQI84_08165 [bacterium]|nr:hypothetical protein [bacterium]